MPSIRKPPANPVCESLQKILGFGCQPVKSGFAGLLGRETYGVSFTFDNKPQIAWMCSRLNTAFEQQARNPHESFFHVEPMHIRDESTGEYRVGLEFRKVTFDDILHKRQLDLKEHEHSTLTREEGKYAAKMRRMPVEKYEAPEWKTKRFSESELHKALTAAKAYLPEDGLLKATAIAPLPAPANPVTDAPEPVRSKVPCVSPVSNHASLIYTARRRLADSNVAVKFISYQGGDFIFIPAEDVSREMIRDALKLADQSVREEDGRIYVPSFALATAVTENSTAFSR